MLRHSRWRDKVASVVLVFSSMFVVSIFFYLVYNNFSDLDRVNEFLSSLLASRINRVDWHRILLLNFLLPFLAFAITLGLAELVLALPGTIRLYRGFGALAIEISKLLLCIVIWKNPVATVFAALLLVYTYSFMRSGGYQLFWVDVLKEVRTGTDFWWHRLVLTFVAAAFHSVLFHCNLVGNILITKDFAGWSSLLLNIGGVVFVWVVYAVFMFILRGVVTSCLIEKWFLLGTPYSRKAPMKYGLFKLLTDSLGTIGLAALYYGVRNGALTCLIAAWNVTLGFPTNSLSSSLADLFTSFVILTATSSQKYRALFLVLAYSNSFAESLMLVAVYPPFKFDLINRMASNVAFMVAMVCGDLALVYLNSYCGAINMVDSTRIVFVITVHCYMTAQLVFEPWRAVSFGIGIGLSEDPKGILRSTPWLEEFYPTFL